MRSLKEILLEDRVRPRVVAATVTLVESRVADTGGVAGIAARGGLSVLRKLSPTFVEDAVDGLLPDFAAALEPFHQAASAGEGLGTHLGSRQEAAAEALLSVTDGKIDRARPAVQKIYRKLRGSARGHVVAAVPPLGTLLQAFVAAEGS